MALSLPLGSLRSILLLEAVLLGAQPLGIQVEVGDGDRDVCDLCVQLATRSGVSLAGVHAPRLHLDVVLLALEFHR